MTIIWTLGFMGWVGIPFTQLLVAVPPTAPRSRHRLRYSRHQSLSGGARYWIGNREFDAADHRPTARRLLHRHRDDHAGIRSNLTSRLQPIREFGLVAAIGILVTSLIFGIFLPAAKVADGPTSKPYDLPVFGLRPLGEEGSVLGRILHGSVTLARRGAPFVLAFALLMTVVSGYYATGIRYVVFER